jgi:hypothetical protein
MEKTLLQNLAATPKTSSIPDPPAIYKEDRALITLLKELKPHLEDAAQDLLSPRPEAVREILKKASM